MVMVVSTAGMIGRGRTGTLVGISMGGPTGMCGYSNFDFDRESEEEIVEDEATLERKAKKAVMDKIRHKRNKERKRGSKG